MCHLEVAVKITADGVQFVSESVVLRYGKGCIATDTVGSYLIRADF